MEQEQAQAAEGYACICGYKTIDVKAFRGHVMRAAKRDGKGSHKSVGRVNMQTGGVTMPPFNERTPEEKAQSTYKVTSQKTKESAPPRLTDSWDGAVEFRVVPRVFQMDFTPTMRMAKVASIREWGWQDFPWADFFDTCLYILFKEHGITLAGYIVHENKDDGKAKVEQEQKEEVATSEH